MSGFGAKYDTHYQAYLEMFESAMEHLRRYEDTLDNREFEMYQNIMRGARKHYGIASGIATRKRNAWR